MSITIREQVRVTSDRSVQVTSPLLEPGTKADVIVLVNATTVPGSRYASFDAMRANPIDAPEDYSTSFENDQRL